MKTVFLDDCFTLRSLYRWFQDFANLGYTLDNAASSGHLCSIRTEEAITIVKELIDRDPRLSVREIADCMEIDQKTDNLHDAVYYPQQFSKNVP